MNLQESIRRILKEETDSVKNLNESKTSQHLKLMNNLLDPLKKKDCLCDIKISFDVEENYYDIYLVFSQKELHEKFFDVVGIRSYIQKMMNEVKMELESFLPIRNVFIGNYTKPNCEWSPLNESENKKSGLLKAIEEDGLYEVITSTSLHIHEIEQKVGQLSKEILERFIIDVVKENHSDIDEDGQTYYIYLEDYPFNEVPVGNNDYVEELKVTNNELFFVVSHFEEDKYGELEFSSKELIPSNNLEYDNIYEIAGQMGFLLSKGLI